MTDLDSPDIRIPEVAEPADTEATSVAQELIAMRQMSGRLDQLDEPTRQRVLRWLVARYGER